MSQKDTDVDSSRQYKRRLLPFIVLLIAGALIFAGFIFVPEGTMPQASAAALT